VCHEHAFVLGFARGHEHSFARDGGEAGRVIVDYASPLFAPRRSRRRSRRPLLLGAAVAVAACFAMTGVAQGAGRVGAPTMVVSSGDTLWNIAAQRYPGDDTRQVVQEILQLNRLSSPVIQPGETLTLPGQ
jgi:nucleoid-associated protein YgaU